MYIYRIEEQPWTALTMIPMILISTMIAELSEQVNAPNICPDPAVSVCIVVYAVV